jgi:hypothetical protein
MFNSYRVALSRTSDAADFASRGLASSNPEQLWTCMCSERVVNVMQGKQKGFEGVLRQHRLLKWC